MQGLDREESEFTRRIRRLMRDLDMDEEEFAYAIGVSRRTMVRYMNSETLPTTDILCRIADKFGESVDWILGRIPM